MATDINSITLVGRLTKAPESREAGATTLTKLRLAFSHSKKVGDSWEDQSQYVDVTVFGRLAEALAGALDKGDQVVVTGRLAWREWQAQDGSTRQAHEIVAQAVQRVSPRKDRQEGQSATEGPQNGSESATDDIPF
jgi:single-strand DNA-binding protein